jgi:hypothetical protein
MKSMPPLLWLMALLGAVSGLVLPAARKSGSVVAWCVFTACIVAVVFVLCLICFYFAVDGREERALSFANWPKELDILISDKDVDRRTFAAARLQQMAKLPNWPYRADAVNVLTEIARSQDVPQTVRGSALGALAALDPEGNPWKQELRNVMKAESNPYVLLAAIPLFVEFPDFRNHVLSLIAQPDRKNPDLIMAFADAIQRAHSQAGSDIQKLQYSQDLQNIKNELEEHPSPEAARFLEHCQTGRRPVAVA